MKDQKYLFVLGGMFLVVLTTFVALKARNTWIERDYIGKAARDRYVITVTGEGKATSTPDLAKITISVYSDGPTVSSVQQANASKMNAVIAAVKALGVLQADIQTSDYRLDPKIDWQNNHRNIMGYTLTQSLSLKIRNLDSIGAVIEKVTAAGANEIAGMQLTVDDPSLLRERARDLAIQEAQRKAEKLADVLGLHLIKVVSFSENGGSQPLPMAYLERSDLKATGGGVAPQIETGSLDVTSAVSVTFEVR